MEHGCLGTSLKVSTWGPHAGLRLGWAASQAGQQGHGGLRSPGVTAWLLGMEEPQRCAGLVHKAGFLWQPTGTTAKACTAAGHATAALSARAHLDLQRPLRGERQRRALPRRLLLAPALCSRGLLLFRLALLPLARRRAAPLLHHRLRCLQLLARQPCSDAPLAVPVHRAVQGAAGGQSTGFVRELGCWHSVRAPRQPREPGWLQPASCQQLRGRRPTHTPWRLSARMTSWGTTVMRRACSARVVASVIMSPSHDRSTARTTS